MNKKKLACVSATNTYLFGLVGKWLYQFGLEWKEIWKRKWSRWLNL